MKTRFGILVQGELQRLHKYNFTSISVFVAFIWGVVLYFLDSDMLSTFLPLILMLDATMMAVMYVGAVMYFEKNESTISTLLVTPITNSELILSKVVSYTLHNLLSAVLLIIVFVLIRYVQMNYILILVGIVLTTGFFTTAGVVLSYFQKDFTTMLVQIMMLAFALFIPQILVEFNVLKGDFWEIIMYINPIQVASNLIGYAFDGNMIDNFDYFYSLGYIILGGVLLYRFLALPKFQEYAVKQSGV